MLNLRQASMRNVWIIAHREYMERIRTRGFLITTVMIPLIMAGFGLGSMFLGSRTSRDFRIAVVSSDPQFARDLQEQLRAEESQTIPERLAATDRDSSARSRRPANITIDTVAPGEGTRKRLEAELRSGRLDGYLSVVPASSVGSPPDFMFTPRTSGMGFVKDLLATSVGKVLLRERLESRGVDAKEASSLLQPVTINEVNLTNHEDTESAEVCVSVLFFVMYLVIMLYGMNVARSIIEEKTSRIFEVMMATIRPEALMAGKIIGVGSVGLTQVGIWLGMLLLGAASSIAIHLGGDTLHIAL